MATVVLIVVSVVTGYILAIVEHKLLQRMIPRLFLERARKKITTDQLWAEIARGWADDTERRCREQSCSD